MWQVQERQQQGLLRSDSRGPPSGRSLIPHALQDEHPALPENVSGDMQGFLLQCFQKDPQKRPGARALLRHAWLRQQAATLRSTWSHTVKARGGRTDAHASVTNVVERILQVALTFR